MVNSSIQGHCDSRFQLVQDAFAKHLNNPREYGAALAICLDGEAIVDLWGGYQDDRQERPWNEDTIVCMFSTGKSLGVLCVLRLVDQGKIDLDDPVSLYWPAFGQGNKAAVTFRHILSHLSGIVFLDDLEPGSCFDYQQLVRAVERKEPDWTPGAHPAYHTFTIGILVREIVSRVTGMHIDGF